MAERDATSGPIILWINHGIYDGWRARSFDSLKEALDADRYGQEFLITRLVRYEVSETSEPLNE